MVKRIIVGVDFSPASRKALERAYETSKTLGVPLTAVHILHPPAPSLPEAQVYATAGLVSADWLASVKGHAAEQLELWLKDFPGTIAQVQWGNPGEGLVGAADADTLMVVGSVGHSAFEHVLFGSTAVKVVKHAPCDVLVVRGERR
jgi:universal stress protein A